MAQRNKASAYVFNVAVEIGGGCPCANVGNVVANSVQVQAAGACCCRISNAAFKFREGEVGADVDGAAFR